jgi:outer membrane protein
MKIKNKVMLFFALFGFSNVFSQETILNLKEAIDLAITKSNEAIIANTNVESKKLELVVSKNNQYPDLKISGQYLRLTGADVDLKLGQNSSSGSSSDINQLVLGQASANMVLFSGFKLKYMLQAKENLYKAEQSKSIQTKEEIAMKVVEYYANLYNSQKSTKLISENLRSAQQRVAEFKDLEQNGIIARNELLKAELQESKVQLSLDEMNKNVSVLNFNLITLLKLPETLRIVIDEHQFDNNQVVDIFKIQEFAQTNRKDLESFHYIETAAQNNIDIAKSGYYPQIVLKAGYVALQLQNVATVTNAVNFGLGLQYDLASVLKVGNEVKLAENKLLETKQSKEILSENVKIQVNNSVENYNLTLKQNLVYQQAVGQATENYRIIKDKYENGLATTNELLEADVEQLKSNLNYTLSRANSFLKYYEMQSASGSLTASFKLANK